MINQHGTAYLTIRRFGRDQEVGVSYLYWFDEHCQLQVDIYEIIQEGFIPRPAIKRHLLQRLKDNL